MATQNIILAGFGGQGILFSGKVIAYAGLVENKEVSWLPSYGPEMRGGTANCSVCLSDEPVGSPLILEPNVLMVLNTPSYEKFIDVALPGATVIVDSTLIAEKSARTDLNIFYIPATKLASDNHLQGLANIIAVGKMLKETGFASLDAVDKAIQKSVPASKTHLVEANMRAVRLGMEL